MQACLTGPRKGGMFAGAFLLCSSFAQVQSCVTNLREYETRTKIACPVNASVELEISYLTAAACRAAKGAELGLEAGRDWKSPLRRYENFAAA